MAGTHLGSEAAACAVSFPGMEEGDLLPLLLLIRQCFMNFSSLSAIFSIFADFLCQIM